MDYSDFDRLPRTMPGVSILDRPSCGGIRAMPTLDRVAYITSGQLAELHLEEWMAARRAGVDERIVHGMTHGTPVPIAPALRVFDAIGVKAEQVPPEYLEA